jgi:hypothetical protein
VSEKQRIQGKVKVMKERLTHMLRPAAVCDLNNVQTDDKARSLP